MTFIVVVALIAMLAFIVGIVYWTKSKLIKRAGKHILKSFLSSSNIYFLISVVSLLLIAQSSSITVTSRSPREMVRICLVGKQNVVSTFLSFKKTHRNYTVHVTTQKTSFLSCRVTVRRWKRRARMPTTPRWMTPLSSSRSLSKIMWWVPKFLLQRRRRKTGD